MAFNLDTSPLPSDFDTIHEILMDMCEFSDRHPNHVLLPADDPGYNHNPPRMARWGWVAYLPNSKDEQPKHWTILLGNVAKEMMGIGFAAESRHVFYEDLLDGLPESWQKVIQRRFEEQVERQRKQDDSNALYVYHRHGDPQELAKLAYQAYGSVTDFKNYQGLPMPAYDDLPPKIKEAWGAAVKRLVDI